MTVKRSYCEGDVTNFVLGSSTGEKRFTVEGRSSWNTEGGNIGSTTRFQGVSLQTVLSFVPSGTAFEVMPPTDDKVSLFNCGTFVLEESSPR